MKKSDFDYYAARAGFECRAAREATSEEARAVHSELARAYSDRLAEVLEVRPRRTLSIAVKVTR